MIPVAENAEPKPEKTNSVIDKIKSLWRSKRLLLTLGVIAVLAASAGVSLALFLRSRPFQKRELSSDEAQAFSKDDRNISELGAGLPTLARPVNILILGTVVLSSDRPSLAEPNQRYFKQIENNLDGQSDAIILVRLDPQQQKISALSIPRDTLVQIPELGLGKINSANFAGGVVLSARTVSNLLGGIQIDRYVRVNVSGFNKLIDALGGVEIYVPKDMKYQDDSQRLYINLKAGKQILNGDKAVQYMRFRQDDLGDIGRVQRQQAFIRALIQQKLNLDTVTKLPEIFDILKENLDTNLSVEEILAMGNFAAKVGRKDARLLMLPGRFSGNEYALSYWLVNEPALAKIMAEQFQIKMALSPPTPPAPTQIRISVQDSLNPSANKNHNDRLQSAVSKLRQKGYSSTNPEPSSELPPLPTTLIIAQNGDRASAEAVRQALGVGEIVIEATGVLESDITVRLGSDWQ